MSRGSRKDYPYFYFMRITFLIFFCLLSSTLFGQTPHQIEADLLKSFKKIGYWSDKKDADTTGDVNIYDKLDKANNVFLEKLCNYSIHNPITINYPYKSLRKEYLQINTSDDGALRVYSWDTETGGTMHFFNNVFQYKTGDKIRVVVDTLVDNLYKLYTFKASSQTYYLGVSQGIESSRYYNKKIMVFSIKDGKLNTDTKIIKTNTGLYGSILYEYDMNFVSNRNEVSDIFFDGKTKTIHIPLVTAKGEVTKNFIIYKFNGQYFERVKN